MAGDAGRLDWREPDQRSFTQFWSIPFMTDGVGARTIGVWFGTGPDRGIALVFVIVGVVGLVATLLALRSRTTGS